MTVTNETKGILGFIAILVALIALAASLLIPANDPVARAAASTAQALGEQNATAIATYHPTLEPTFIPLPTATTDPNETPTPMP